MVSPVCYTERRAGGLPPGARLRTGVRPMRERIEQFLEHLATERGVSRNTIAAYRNDLRQFARYMESTAAKSFSGGVPAITQGEIEREAVLGFLLSLKENNGYAPATVARKIAALKSLCHYLYKAGSIRSDPTIDLGTPEVKKSLPRALGVSAIDALLNHAEKRCAPEGLRDRAMLKLLNATGMRVTELVSLDLADLDLCRALVRCTGRAGRVRMIPVAEGAVGPLGEYMEHARVALARHNPAEPALFLNHRGQRLTRQGFWLIIKILAQDAGIVDRITPHMLRHSFAAQWLHDGLAIKQLKEILGHANISTTQVYAQIRVDGARARLSVPTPVAPEPVTASPS